MLGALGLPTDPAKLHMVEADNHNFDGLTPDAQLAN